MTHQYIDNASRQWLLWADENEIRCNGKGVLLHKLDIINLAHLQTLTLSKQSGAALRSQSVYLIGSRAADERLCKAIDAAGVSDEQDSYGS